MSWATRLKKAQWRGMAFLHEQVSKSGGRRVAVHEYPFADDPSPEDLGLKAQEFAINAYFIGANYDTEALKFEGLLNKQGTGELHLPLESAQQVQLLTWQRTDSTAQQGLARFTLKFVQGEALRYPVAQGNEQADLLDSHNHLNQTTEMQFSDWLKAWKAARSSALFEINEQLKNVAAIFSQWQGITSIPDANSVGYALFSWLQSLVTVDLPKLPGHWTEDVPSFNTPLETTLSHQQSYQQALLELADTRVEPPDILLGALQSQAIETAVRLGVQTFTSYNQAQNIQQGINQIITQVVEYPALRERYTNEALGDWSDLRVQVAEHVREQRLVLPSIKHTYVGKETPAVVIAYRLYQNAHQADQLTQQNGLAHPGFCQGKLEYLA